MSTLRSAATLAFAALTIATAPALARAAGAAKHSRAPARFDVAHGLCKQFLDLPTDLRGMVVAWTTGRYHKLDSWVLEEATARRVVDGVQRECEKTPDGLFRYKVVGEVGKLK